MFRKFPKVRKLSDAVRNMNGQPPILYRAKVKLHGTNAGINIESNGNVTFQSRNREIFPGEGDNAGFAAEMSKLKNLFQVLHYDYTIYGEWVGPNIQKGVGISKIDHPIFYAFLVVSHDDLIFYDPELWLPRHKMFRVTPWYGKLFRIDPNKPNTEEINWINNEVTKIDQQCPVALEDHNIVGTGEGLVCYPRVENFHQFADLVWKAKGPSHQVSATPKPAKMKPQMSADAAAFIETHLTENRLQQALAETGSYKNSIGPMLKWIGNDLKTECAAELEASGLIWKAVNKPMVAKVKQFLFTG